MFIIIIIIIIIIIDTMNLFYSFFLIIYSVSCCFMDEFSDDKFKTLWLFIICIFILVFWNVLLFFF